MTEARSALIVGALAFAAAMGGHVIAAADDNAPALPPDCIAMVREVGDLARRLPNTARLYARPGPDPALPRLATKREIDACGDPEVLLEQGTQRDEPAG